MKIIIKNDIKEILKKYNINYSNYTLDNLDNLIEILDDMFLDNLDDKDEPTDKAHELEKARDSLFYWNFQNN